MPTPPIEPQNPLAAAAASIAGPLRQGVQVRNLMQWFVPEKGIVEMYINPQQVSYQFKKNITKQRTKGGFVLQYWGEDLTGINIQGTTGSSGVRGINVLNDVYRNEQVQFDPYALALASDRSKENEEFSFLGDFPGDGAAQSLLGGIGESFVDLVANSVETGSPKTTRPAPTLASLAFTVELYYSNWSFRGFFEEFRVDERANNLGLFDYTIVFTVTQQRGIRPNFLGWHREPDGPSNTDPVLGRPYSYTNLVEEQSPPTGRANVNNGLSLTDLLKNANPLAPLSDVGTAFKSIF